MHKKGSILFGIEPFEIYLLMKDFSGFNTNSIQQV